MKDSYKNPYGTWEVKTVIGEDGSVVKGLGTFIGYVDEIALHLADKCGHYLDFKRIEACKDLRPTGFKVAVSFHPECEGIDTKALIARYSNRPVDVVASGAYQRITIVSKRKDEFIKEKALSKLTDEERRVLGL